MERTKHRLISLFILLWITSVLQASYRTEVYNAYVNNKMEIWKEVIDRMDRVPDKTNEFILELVNYQYGYIGYCLGYDRKNEAKVYLEKAQKYIDLLEKQKYRLATVNAYNAAFCGFRMGINPLSVPYNGIRSIEYARKALELDSNDFFGYIQYGNIQFYMPKTFGGSKKEGVGHYLKAKEILERNGDDIQHDWNYLAVLIVIGQSYYYMGDYESSKAAYDHILKLEPGFTYVRDELIPQLSKKMKE